MEKLDFVQLMREQTELNKLKAENARLLSFRPHQMYWQRRAVRLEKELNELIEVNEDLIKRLKRHGIT